VSSDVNVSSQKFNVKLYVPEADGMTELWLRLESVRDDAIQVVCYKPFFLLETSRNFCLDVWSYTVRYVAFHLWAVEG